MRLFDSIRVSKPRLNKFDLSHERKLSMQMGPLVPIMCNEIMPGDKFRVNTEIAMRMIPMLAPIMHRVNVFTHYFFVPNRLIWDEWEDFITGGRLGTSAPVAPHALASVLTTEGYAQQPSGLLNYLGFPTTLAASADPASDLQVSMLPTRAYQLIWDEFYRDQNVSAALDISKASGAIGAGAELDKLCTIRLRAWEKDYFTSALPFAQRGAAVGLPIELTGDAPIFADPLNPAATSSVVEAIEQPGSSNVGYSVQLDPTIGGGDLVARLDGMAGTSSTINDLRRSWAIQRWLERNARGGARYVEFLLHQFGKKSSDARLQRPEYLGGGRTPMQISEVLQTVQQVAADVPVGNPLGDMGGHGFSIGNMNGFRRSFEEHGFVIGLMSVLPRTAYQQGVHRMWTRMDKFDYPYPVLANIGEQEVKNYELYFTGDVAVPGTYDPLETFGYQSRYAEWKYGCSSVHGEFQDTLAFWHMGRIFEDAPALNEAFIGADPTTRIFANESTNEGLYVHLFNKVDALRPLPYYGTPS